MKRIQLSLCKKLLLFFITTWTFSCKKDLMVNESISYRDVPALDDASCFPASAFAAASLYSFK